MVNIESSNIINANLFSHSLVFIHFQIKSKIIHECEKKHFPSRVTERPGPWSRQIENVIQITNRFL